MNRFVHKLAEHSQPLVRARAEILQINLGKLCNLTCNHCHVNAGPKRKEIMTRETLDRVVDWFADSDIPTVDLTGGAPEMIPHFRYLIKRLRALTPRRRILDRCNVTILEEPGYEDMADFLCNHEVEIIASMPCYSAENVNAQRGEGVFDASIAALQKLNRFGYGRREDLPLHLVYNPNGAFLPAPQAALEGDYKRELQSHFGIDFHHLYAITNLPVSRFASWLKQNGKYEEYLELLVTSFNPATVSGLMCRNTINVGWGGEVFDCDFNQMLGMQWNNGKPLYLWDINATTVEGRTIATGDHCFGCTAGAGSGCGGSVL